MDPENESKIHREVKKETSHDTIVSSSSSFYLSVKGQIINGLFPGKDNLYCKYCFFYGDDWQVISGQEENCSQIALKTSDSGFRSIWNLPIDVTFRSSNPFKWPSLVVSVYGSDFFGNDVVRGYGATHVPSISGHHERQIATFVPKSSSLLNAFQTWFTGKRAEFLDSRIVAQGNDRSIVRVSTQGMVTVAMDIILKDFHKHGYKNK